MTDDVKMITVDMIRGIDTCKEGVDIYIQTMGLDPQPYDTVLQIAMSIDASGQYPNMQMTRATLAIGEQFLGITQHSNNYTYSVNDHSFDTLEEAQHYKDVVLMPPEYANLESTINIGILKEVFDESGVSVMSSCVHQDIDTWYVDGAIYHVHNLYDGTYTQCNTRHCIENTCSLILDEGRSKLNDKHTIHTIDTRYNCFVMNT